MINNNDMRIKVIYSIFLLALSLTLSANETLQNDSTNSQIVPQANKVVTNSISNNPDEINVVPSPNENQSQQSDNNDISEIRKYTKETANNTEKGGYDIGGIILSALAFITALVTLIFTIRTYKSQKQTQKNTTKVFTREKQYEVLVSISEKIIDNYIEAGTIKLYTSLMKLPVFPSNMLFTSQYIDFEELHLELFYDLYEEDESATYTYRFSGYSRMSKLKNGIQHYNNIIKTISNQLQEKRIDYDMIKREYNHYVFDTLINLLCQISAISNEYLKDDDKRIDMRKNMVYYIWERSGKVIYSLEEIESHFNSIMQKFKDDNDPKYEITNSILSESKALLGGLFEGFDLSKAIRIEPDLNVDKLALLLVYAIIGDFIDKENVPLFLKYQV